MSGKAARGRSVTRRIIIMDVNSKRNNDLDIHFRCPLATRLTDKNAFLFLVNA